MDELFGDVFERRPGAAPARRLLAGGRRLLRRRPAARGRARRARRHRPDRGRARDPRARARARRPAPPAERGEGRVYQQLEIEHGPFRRVVALGADVDADAAQRRLRGRHAARRAAARPPPSRARTRPDRGPRSRRTIEIERPAEGGQRGRRSAAPALPAELPVLPLRDTVTFPDTLTPLAVGQERSIAARQRRARRRPHARDGRQPRPRGRGARARAALRRRRRRRRRAHAQGARRDAADPRPGRRSACASTSWVAERALPRRAASTELPDVVERGAGADRARCATSSRRSRSIVEEVPYLPEELQIAVANLEDPSARSPPDRRRAAAQDRGEAGAARGGRRRASACGGCPRSSRASSRSSRSARRSSRRSSPSWTRRSASTSCASS